jgi:2-succinyl-6-hydroxy-2,4-cyclohexadiene-1-carboxylate synthase
MSLPIVFLHGFLGGRESFAEVKAHLPGPYPTLSPLLFGHRGRPEVSRAHDFDAETTRLLAVIRAEFQREPVHLVGYSLGGRLALALLVEAPERFASVTLISTRRGLDDPALRAERLEQDRAWAAKLERGPLSRFLDEWEQNPLFASQQQLSPLILEHLRKQRLEHDPSALAQAMTALSLGRMPSFANELPSIGCPVVLMVGEHDTKFRSLAADLGRRIPKAGTIVVSGAGHNLPLERPAAVAAAISEGIDNAEH